MKTSLTILICAPRCELDKIHPHMDGRLSIKYFELDAGARLPRPLPQGCPDTHISILQEFIVPDELMDDIIAGLEKVYAAINDKDEASEMLYYGFSVCDNSVFCREGYMVG